MAIIKWFLLGDLVAAVMTATALDSASKVPVVLLVAEVLLFVLLVAMGVTEQNRRDLYG